VTSRAKAKGGGTRGEEEGARDKNDLSIPTVGNFEREKKKDRMGRNHRKRQRLERRKSGVGGIWGYVNKKKR